MFNSKCHCKRQYVQVKGMMMGGDEITIDGESLGFIERFGVSQYEATLKYRKAEVHGSFNDAVDWLVKKHEEIKKAL